ncbi:MAG: hypothetical protein [Caudoviricetes sp.]|nr:MAG: hypothetical protein [Caudoviricetes sp.]
MNRSKWRSVLWSAALAVIAWASNTFLHLSTFELGVTLATATAAPLFGLVLFDFKAFSRAANEVSNMILGRLGHRTFGTAGLCRPHGL